MAGVDSALGAVSRQLSGSACRRTYSEVRSVPSSGMDFQVRC